MTERLTVLDAMVTQTIPNLHGQYMTTVNASTALQGQNTGLQAQVRELEAKHAALQATADTYDREFLDRPPVAMGFWSRAGFQTFQDWILAAFFLLYGVVCLIALVFVLKFSNKKLQGGALVVGVSVVFGVMMTGVISRFA